MTVAVIAATTVNNINSNSDSDSNSCSGIGKVAASIVAINNDNSHFSNNDTQAVVVRVMTVWWQ